MSQVQTAGVKTTIGQCVYKYNVLTTWSSLYNRQSFINCDITNNPASSTDRCLLDNTYSAAHSYEVGSNTRTLVTKVHISSKCEKLYYNTRGPGRIT